jgi:protein-disulfide isomerase
MSARLTPPVNERDHLAGPANAPIVLVEYGDYECPFCGHAYYTVKSLQEQLGDRLCFVFRNFPLATVHPHALDAAEAAEAAGAQGLFWPMHDTLFENQDTLEPPDLIRYATQLGLEVNTFEYDLRTHRFRDRIGGDRRSGALSGVNGTPTFFINGYRHEGRADLDSLFRAIAENEELMRRADLV